MPLRSHLINRVAYLSQRRPIQMTHIGDCFGGAFCSNDVGRLF
jgi:hypothetical protein